VETEQTASNEIQECLESVDEREGRYKRTKAETLLRRSRPKLDFYHTEDEKETAWRDAHGGQASKYIRVIPYVPPETPTII
jgi:hypothetical protein